MALNLADRLAVRAVIVPRCTAIIVNYANYILGEDPQTANHTNRISWAREAIRTPEPYGSALSYYVLSNDDYITDGSGITDEDLKGTVENAVNLHFIQS